MRRSSEPARPSMPETTPTLTLVPTPVTVEGLAALVMKLTGRAPTAKEVAAAKTILEAPPRAEP